MPPNAEFCCFCFDPLNTFVRIKKFDYYFLLEVLLGDVVTFVTELSIGDLLLGEKATFDVIVLRLIVYFLLIGMATSSGSNYSLLFKSIVTYFLLLPYGDIVVPLDISLTYSRI